MPALYAASLGLCVAALPASSQVSKKGMHATPRAVVIPSTSKAAEEDLGLRSHTNVRFLAEPGPSPAELPPFTGYAYETPASLGCVYGLTSYVQGCNPNATTQNPSGGSQTIAIVDAFEDPNAPVDLEYFSQAFGLPYSASKFQVVYANGNQPPEDPTGGWELEESLDIEYAHAMAPNAMIYLVEANSNLNSDLYAAVQTASNLVACGKTTTCPQGSKGKGEVSMSFITAEFADELSYDSIFTTPNVVYIAAAGDASGVGYPCASPNVVCAGGTTNSRSLENGNLIAQIAWSEAGGGISAYERIPSYQAKNPFIANQLDGYRGVPDISANSNPTTGVWVWDTFPYNGAPGGWYTTGGTSAATPILAGIINSNGSFATSSSAELTKLYGNSLFFLDGGGVTDIYYGACNFYASSFAQIGWDQCTGLGAPYRLK